MGLAAASLTPGMALAHREAASHTAITWNAASKTLDVTHRFHMHDAATGLARAGFIERPNLLSLKARAQLALYTDENFTLKTLSNADIALDIVGVDYDSKNVYVFQQAALQQAPIGLSISCQLLSRLVPRQVNDIDIDLGGPVRSLRFKTGDKAKIVLA